MKNNLTRKSLNLTQSLVLAVCLTFLPVLPSFAQQAVLRTLTVTGQGELSIPTTLTRISLGVEIQGKTAQEVQAEAAQRSTQLVNFLRSQNVSKLETTGISLQPQYNYESNQRELIGYIATNMVSFEVDTQKAGSILDQSVAVGATRIDNISFTATEAAIAQAQKEALREATLEAQAQAEAVLSTLNLTPQEIVSIQVNGATPPVTPMLQAAMMRDESFKTAVVGGEQTIQSSVTLQIRY
jgi:uncharacterized protein